MSDELLHLIDAAFGGSNRPSQSYSHVFHGEPFPWQTGDPFWDGFKLTHEVKTLGDGQLQMIYHVTAATREQKDRFLALMNLTDDGDDL